MDEETDRACIACPAVYVGGEKCPDSGKPGEPLPGVPMVELMDDSGEWLRGAARADAIKRHMLRRPPRLGLRSRHRIERP